jgi:RNA polymerase sigma-70 factor (ECF subfamily)
MVEPAEEAELIVEAQQGHRAAFAEIYRRYQPAVYRYIYYRVGDVSLAEDLTAAVFVRVVEKLDSYRHAGRPFLAWLYAIAHNVVVDHHRRAKQSTLVPLYEGLVDESQSVERAAEQYLTQAQLAAAMTELTEEQRQVIILRFVEGMTCEQVGRVLRRSTGAVKSLQHRALAALARILGPRAS